MWGGFSWRFFSPCFFIWWFFLVALHHPGCVDRESLPRRQLLSLARDGAGRGGAAASEGHQVPSGGNHRLLRGLGDAAFDHRNRLRNPGDGRVDAPHSWLPRCHVRQEHRGEYHDPHDVHELPAVSPNGKGHDGGMVEDGPRGAARYL